jgi:hypothetical protein
MADDRFTGDGMTPVVPTRGIVIPTYVVHFPAVLRFLESARRFIRDDPRVPIRVVTSDAEETELLNRQLAQPDRDCVRVVSIRDLLREYGYAGAESFSVKQFENKFSYQSIKKILGVIQFDFDQTLLLDSECLVFAPVSLNEVFASYFASPVLFHSAIRHPMLERVNRASASVIGENSAEVLSRWIFEYQGWFFEKSAVTAFRDHVWATHGKDLIDVLVGTPDVFETISYNWFLYTHRDNYPKYRFVAAEEAVRQHLGESAEAFLADYENRPYGIVEHFLRGLKEENFEGLRSFVTQNDLRFFRWELWQDDHYWLVRRFLNMTPSLALLACSEDGPVLLSKSFRLRKWVRWLGRSALQLSGLRSRRRSV